MTKRFVTLKIEAGAYDPPYMATIWQGDVVVGEAMSVSGERFVARLEEAVDALARETPAPEWV